MKGFFNSLIIGEIFKYLSIEDLFRFICINKYFYNVWIKDFGHALNLKKLLIERFGWRVLYSKEDYDIIDMFRFMIRKMERDRKCACIGGCGYISSLLNFIPTTPKILSKQIICYNCFNEKDTKYVSIDLAVEKHIELLKNKIGKKIYHVKENRIRLRNSIYNRRNDMVFKDVIPVKFIKEKVEEDFNNLKLYERKK